jgi:hypothetical protein
MLFIYKYNIFFEYYYHTGEKKKNSPGYGIFQSTINVFFMLQKLMAIKISLQFIEYFYLMLRDYSLNSEVVSWLYEIFVKRMPSIYPNLTKNIATQLFLRMLKLDNTLRILCGGKDVTKIFLMG